MTLVDTSAWIEFLRGTGTPAALRVRELLDADEAAWCEMVVVELWNGASGAHRPKLEALERAVHLASITAAVWTTARNLAASARSASLTIPSADLVIAARAKVHGLDIAHHQDHHFDALAKLQTP